MGKIKGWLKYNDNNWLHDSKIHSVNVKWTAFGYVVHGIGVSKPFTTKTKAREAAIKYMRSHPNG